MAEITPGTQVGNWQILRSDNRRATCICVCGVARVIATASLLDGTATPSCGCAELTADRRSALRDEEARQQRQREMRGWRPQT
jgi:hypothetical protein